MASFVSSAATTLVAGGTALAGPTLEIGDIAKTYPEHFA